MPGRGDKALPLLHIKDNERVASQLNSLCDPKAELTPVYKVLLKIGRNDSCP